MPVALAGLAVLSVIPLRGHALTYLAGGPAIATLTAADSGKFFNYDGKPLPW